MSASPAPASRPHEPRVLLFDIEVTPNLGTFWDPLINGGYINHENIVEERYVICISWKWLGEQRVHSASILTHPSKQKGVPDAGVLRKFHGEWEKADAVIAHNGDKFDVPWIKTRLMLLPLKPLKPLMQIDTRKLAKRMKFNSNALNYLGRFLSLGQKIKTDLDLWHRVRAGEKKAVEEMVTYNREDVRLLERFYLKIRPHVPSVVNRALWSAADIACPSCGSSEMQARGKGHNRVTAYHRFQCMACGAWSNKPTSSKVVR